MGVNDGAAFALLEQRRTAEKDRELGELRSRLARVVAVARRAQRVSTSPKAYVPLVDLLAALEQDDCAHDSASGTGRVEDEWRCDGCGLVWREIPDPDGQLYTSRGRMSRVVVL